MRIIQIIHKIINIIMKLIVVVSILFFLVLFFFPNSGAWFSINLPDGIHFNPKPPGNLVEYMNNKYDVEFYELPDNAKVPPFHASVKEFKREYNGIVVATDSIPDHCFYIRKYFGKYADDYGCHMAQKSAEDYLHDKLAPYIPEEFIVVCSPGFAQTKEFDAVIPPEVYLREVGYTFRLYICGDGEDKDENIEQIRNVLNDYRRGGIFIAYCDEEFFRNIDTWDGHFEMVSDHFYYTGDDIFNDSENEDNFEWHKDGIWGSDDSNTAD